MAPSDWFCLIRGVRIYRQLHGAPAGFENALSRGAWSKYDGGKKVAVGGADRAVTVWDVESGRILYKVCWKNLPARSA